MKEKINKKVTLKDIFGEEIIESCKLRNSSRKKITMDDILGSDNRTDYDPLLKDRGFTELISNADPKFKKDFAKTLISAEEKVGRIDLPTIIDDKITGMVRGSETEKNIQELMEFITIQNQHILSKDIPSIILGINEEKLSFNKLIEGKYERSHIAFDTEADKYGHCTQCSAVNWEAKRIVVSYYSDEPKLNLYKTEHGWHYYILATDSLWEAPLLANYETLLAVNLISNLEQGSKEVLSIFKALVPKLLENFIIEIEYLAKCLNNQAKGLWICHNNRYDINQLNANYMYKRGKRRKFHIINMKPVEFVIIRHERQDLYKVRLGNSLIGFRFKVQSNTRYSSMHPYAQINLSPIQANQFTMVEGIDTLNLAFAGQFPEKSLSELSKGLKYKKIELNEEKIFDKSDIEIINGKITDKMRYNLMDCFATLNVYAMLSYHFNLTETGRLQQVDLTITKDWHKAFAGSIISPATVSKFIIQTILQKKTGLTIKEMEQNFQLIRQYLSNFKITYKGGRT